MTYKEQSFVRHPINTNDPSYRTYNSSLSYLSLTTSLATFSGIFNGHVLPLHISVRSAQVLFPVFFFGTCSSFLTTLMTLLTGFIQDDEITSNTVSPSAAFVR